MVEPNEKETTLNEELSPDKDKVEAILISDLYVFEKTMVYLRSLLERTSKYMWISDHHLSFRNFISLQLILTCKNPLFRKTYKSLQQ